MKRDETAALRRDVLAEHADTFDQLALLAARCVENLQILKHNIRQEQAASVTLEQISTVEADVMACASGASDLAAAVRLIAGLTTKAS
jgi:hypothetical protein